MLNYNVDRWRVYRMSWEHILWNCLVMPLESSLSVETVFLASVDASMIFSRWGNPPTVVLDLEKNRWCSMKQLSAWVGWLSMTILSTAKSTTTTGLILQSLLHGLSRRWCLPSLLKSSTLWFVIHNSLAPLIYWDTNKSTQANHIGVYCHPCQETSFLASSGF